MGADKQVRLDRLANEFFKFSEEKKELAAIDLIHYEEDISYCDQVIQETLDEIEKLNPPIGTDAYRALWESRGQRRINDALR